MGHEVMRTSSGSYPEAVVLQGWRILRTAWLAEMALVVACWIGVPVVLPRSGNPGQAVGPLALIFYTVGLADIALGLWLKQRALVTRQQTRTHSTEELLSRIFSGSLVAVTSAITPALLGVVLYAGWGSRRALSVLCVLSLIGLWVLRPRLDQLQELIKTTTIDAHRPARG